MARSAEFDDFAIALHPRLVGVLTLHCGDPVVAQDLAQDTLVRVKERWRRVRDATDPQAYAIRIGLNLANSWLRRRVTERRAVARLPRQEGEQRALGDVVAQGQDVRAAMTSLPPRQREVILRRYYLDQSLAEVARAMDITEGSVASACHRGLERLRARLDFVVDHQEVRP